MRILVLLLATSLPHVAAAQQSTSPLQHAAFMAGCWRGQVNASTIIEEYYVAPAANLMQGMTRYLRGERVVDYEFTLLDVDGEQTRLRPHPKGQPSVAFTQVAAAPGQLAWENLQHDFPQRISYAAAAGDSLVARIEGPGPNGTRAFEYRMGRVACPAGAGRD